MQFGVIFIADLFCGPGYNGEEKGSPLQLIDTLNLLLDNPALVSRQPWRRVVLISRSRRKASYSSGEANGLPPRSPVQLRRTSSRQLLRAPSESLEDSREWRARSWRAPEMRAKVFVRAWVWILVYWVYRSCLSLETQILHRKLCSARQDPGGTGRAGSMRRRILDNPDSCRVLRATWRCLVLPTDRNPTPPSTLVYEHILTVRFLGDLR